MNHSMKQHEVLHWASSFLDTYGREENAATLLLQHHLRVDRTEFFQNMHEQLPQNVITAYQKDIKAHAITGVPVQHLIGYAPFYGEDFMVNADVLIPRFETEELVEQVAAYIKEFSNRDQLIVADVGTGSGVIAITLKRMFPELRVIATDISPEALLVAKQNAKHLEAEVLFLQGDLLQPLIKADIVPTIIVSNPPYISYNEEASLSDTVRDFDPELALFAEENGLQVYRRIMEQATTLSAHKLRAIFFEIGEKQGKDVYHLMQTYYPERFIDIRKDLAGKDRFVIQV